MKKFKGFTLIELLISVALMVIIVAVCATIFRTTSTAYTMGEARIKMYASARGAMDLIERDLTSSIPSESGSQRFFFANDYSNGDNDGETLVNVGGAWEGEKDAMLFRTISTTRGSNMALIVGYYLEREFDPELGDAGAGVGITRNYNRRLFVLRRRMWGLTTPPRIERTPESPTDIAHFIVSFNIETWYDLDGPNSAPEPRFYQLDEGNITTNFYRTSLDSATLITNVNNGVFINNDFSGSDSSFSPYPLGNGFPTNPDIDPRGNAINDIKPAAIRITIRMLDGAREVQERIIQRVIWLPVR